MSAPVGMSGRIETGDEVAAVTRSPGAASPSDAAIQARASAGPRPSSREVGEGDGAVALGEAGAVGAEDERDVRPHRSVEAEQIAEQRLRRGGRQQVVAADDLLDALIGVVDDDREVVGEGAVAAAEDDVVDGIGALAVQTVGDRRPRRPRPGGAGRTPHRRPPGGRTRGRKVPARARVEALGRVAVLGRGRLPDLAPRAEAAVDPAVALEPVERRARRGPIRADWRTTSPSQSIPSARRSSSWLAANSLADAALVEVLDPHQEPRAGRPREQPGEQRRPQVAEVEVPGRRRRVAPDHCYSGSTSL